MTTILSQISRVSPAVSRSMPSKYLYFHRLNLACPLAHRRPSSILPMLPINSKTITTMGRNHDVTSRLIAQNSKLWTRNYLGSYKQYSTATKLDDLFKKAQNDVKNHTVDDNSLKLKLYALFKQATIGDCQGPKPSAFSFVETAKYNAWSQLSNMSKDDAMKQYIDTVNSLANDNDSSSSTESAEMSEKEEMLVEIKDQVLWLKFNRPKKYNAITLDMYKVITNQLVLANSNPDIKIVVITGAGKYYSSGNDLTNFFMMKEHKDGFEAGAREGIAIFKRFVESMINLNKFAIAAVNGPSVGIPVTTLALMDYVICSDSATFYTPFTSLGQSPEACSTVTLPRIMGTSRANELLLMNKIFTAADAKSSGLVSDIVPSDNLEATLDEILYGKHGMVKNCYPEALKIGKSLIRDAKHRKMLLDVNAVECETLFGTWLGEEVQDALKKFFARASNQS